MVKFKERYKMSKQYSNLKLHAILAGLLVACLSHAQEDALKDVQGASSEAEATNVEVVAEVTNIEVVAEVTLVRRERVYREPRPHGPSEAELAAHASFLEGVKAPLWNAASAN